MNIKKILASRKLTSADIIIPGMVIILAVVGYFLYNQFANYTYLSDQNNYDILRAKLWTIGWLLISTIIIYWKRNSSHAPAFTVLAISVYFVILYGILFQGTEYGLNGHWGDNGNRLALICKMMAFKSMFYDWYLKDLPSFYPPLWFVIMAIYGKLLNIEAYQTIKFGYLLVFLVYPWLLFFSWKKLVSPLTSAAITFATIFIGYKYLLWVHYQHITASLFLPWWLYYFERATEKKEMLDMNWRFYLKGAIYGGILFMTYYYWFFIAFSALPFVLLLKYIETKSFKLIWDNLKSKAILMFGVAIVSMVYWLP
ncbi:MAG: hypothetical protein ACE5D6_07160, partial [Candidatus Zixiibacteriota bacterium]